MVFTAFLHLFNSYMALEVCSFYMINVIDIQFGHKIVILISNNVLSLTHFYLRSYTATNNCHYLSSYSSVVRVSVFCLPAMNLPSAPLDFSLSGCTFHSMEKLIAIKIQEVTQGKAGILLDYL